MKKVLRTRFRDFLNSITPDQRRTRSAAAAANLTAAQEYQHAQVILAFISLPTEIDTTPIILDAWREHKRVLAPKVSWDQRRMLPIEIHSLTDDLAETQFGIHEPLSGIPFPVPLIDLAIVPGLAFDEYGNRLGRGRGFYDHFLANPEFQGVACACCYDEQIIADVPAGPNDRPVNMVVTDQRVLRFKITAA